MLNKGNQNCNLNKPSLRFLFHPPLGEGSETALLKKDHSIILGIPCNSGNGGKKKPFPFLRGKKRRQEIGFKSGIPAKKKNEILSL